MFTPINRAARRGALRGLRGLFNDATAIAEVKNLVTTLQTELKAKLTAIDTEIAAKLKTLEALGPLNAFSAEAKTKLEALAAEGTKTIDRLVAIEQALVALKTTGRNGERPKTMGEQFVNAESIKAALKEGIGFRGVAKATVNMVTSLTSGDGGAGDLIVPQRLDGIITPPNRTLRVRDLLSKGRTTSNAIEFVQETGFSNMAAMVAEGAQKPESSLSFALQNAPVRTMAHWLQASKQILADVPQLQSYIDTRLRYGLDLVEEGQLLAGDGTGENILGLIPQATAFDRARLHVGDTRIDVIRRAITQLRLAEYSASAIIMHPTDWEEIELLKDSTGQYIWSNPRGLLGPTLWGLPVLDSTTLTEGEFLVGAFNVAAQIWDREDATVDISTEDRDNFIKNLVTIRAEKRLALTVYRPESFIYGDFDNEVST